MYAIVLIAGEIPFTLQDPVAEIAVSFSPRLRKTQPARRSLPSAMSIPRDVFDALKSADNFREASAGIFLPRQAEVQPIPEAESPIHVPADRTKIPPAKRGPTKQSVQFGHACF
jgi:hypothetical protein